MVIKCASATSIYNKSKEIEMIRKRKGISGCLFLKWVGIFLSGVCIIGLLLSIRRFPLSVDRIVINEPVLLTITLVSPMAVHFGDSAKITLSMDMMDDPTGEFTSLPDVLPTLPGGVITEMSTSEIIAEARLDSPNKQVLPAGPIFQPMALRHPVNYSWIVQPGQPGITSSKLWVYVGSGSSPGDEIAKIPILIRDIEIDARKLFGFPTKEIRPLLVCGAIGGLILACTMVRYKGISKKINA